MRITGVSPHECTACHGLGYTKASQAEMRTAYFEEVGWVEIGTVVSLETGKLQVGSGCLMCGGTGQLPPEEKVYDVD